MKPSEAARVVAMLNAYFPGRDVTDETAQLWENEVAKYDLGDAQEAARTIGTMSKYPPTLAYFIESIRDETSHRARNDTAHALPPTSGTLRMGKNPSDDTGMPAEYAVGGAMTFAEFLKRRPDMRQRVEKLGIWRDVLMRADEMAEGA